MELPEDLREVMDSFNADAQRSIEGFRLGVEHAQKLMFANLMALTAKRNQQAKSKTENAGEPAQ